MITSMYVFERALRPADTVFLGHTTNTSVLKPCIPQTLTYDKSAQLQIHRQCQTWALQCHDVCNVLVAIDTEFRGLAARRCNSNHAMLQKSTIARVEVPSKFIWIDKSPTRTIGEVVSSKWFEMPWGLEIARVHGNHGTGKHRQLLNGLHELPKRKLAEIVKRNS